MKKSIMFFVAAVAAMVFAVNSNAQISVGFGYASESVINKTISDLGDDVTGKAWSKDFQDLDGFYIEAAYNWEFMSLSTGTLSIQPALRFTYGTQRSEKSFANIKDGDDKVKMNSKSKVSNSFFDVPVNVKYSYDLVPGALKAYAFAGPVFSFGIACNSLNYENRKITEGGETTEAGSDYRKINGYNGKYVYKYWDSAENKMVTDKDTDPDLKAYNMFDLKLGLGLGMTVAEKVDVKFGYNLGLLNRSAVKNDDGDKYKAHSNVLWFGVAYNF